MNEQLRKMIWLSVLFFPSHITLPSLSSHVNDGDDVLLGASHITLHLSRHMLMMGMMCYLGHHTSPSISLVTC